MARDFAPSNDLRGSDSVSWSPTGSFSFSAWVWHDANTEGAVIGKWSGLSTRSFVLRVPTNRVVTINILSSVGSGFSATKSGFTESAWHQIGFEWSSGVGLRAILDGVAGTLTGTAQLAINDGTLDPRIGSSADDSTTRYWDGAICDVGSWSVTLSDAEWAALAKGVPARMIRPASVLSYVPVWGAGDPEADLSGNIVNFAVRTSAPLRNHGPVGCPFPVAA